MTKKKWRSDSGPAVQKVSDGWQAGALIYPTRALARTAVRNARRAGAKSVECAARLAVREAYARRLLARE